MLRRLGIRNYALIESLDLEFGRGFTVITGETGSGKSIMLGALSLLAGGRADSRVALGRKSRVEALFEDVDISMRDIFEAKGIEWMESRDEAGAPHNEITIRREISEGRSRVFINDTPVTLATLAEIGPRLIYIHSQHSNAGLADNAEQLRITDIFADNEEIYREYRESFRRFATLKRRIDGIRRGIARNRENEEFLRFQCEQLDRLKPRRGELAAIEKRYEMLSDADEIKEHLSRLSALLGNGEGSILDRIAESKGIIDRLDMGLFGEDARDSDIPGRLQFIQAELEDIADTVEDINSTVDTDPAALEKLSQRMTAYYEAVKRFKVGDADELVDVHERLRGQLAEIAYGGDDLHGLEEEARKEADTLKRLADRLTESREKGAAILTQRISDTAGMLGLPNLRFEIRLERGKLGATGRDHVEFMSCFNRQGDLRPVGDTASGGEISRLMLSIKAVMAERMSMPTIIFDEVDTGVSGEIAERMGRMMHDMGGHMQVMAITHLPQVAAQGAGHFKVYKRDVDDRTVTYVEELHGEERVREIAAMISGSEVTDAALQNARMLIGMAANNIGKDE